MEREHIVIAVIGLGYVGLPLAVEFGKKYKVIGFDINSNRVTQLKNGFDETLEVTEKEIVAASNLTLTTDREKLPQANVYIVTVPTPINEHLQPDLTPLIKASELVAGVISNGDIVIYESTVYPGATEDDCVPVLERTSGLTFNQDFFVGYSPERINPGDKVRRLTDITKVTSGSTPTTADFVDELYRSIVTAGTYKAKNIKIAEASKVIENTQRDINIAIVNEFAKIFGRLGVDTEDVLKAASTKWNFLNFKPGLVGGHCIGVDPYYLVRKSQSVGYHPELILAARRINESMSEHVVQQLINAMLKRRIHVNGARILIMGVAFKENCPDVRNTKIIDIYNRLTGFGVEVDVIDPMVKAEEIRNEYAIELVPKPEEGAYDAIILAVNHNQFRDMGRAEITKLAKTNHVLYDLKHVLEYQENDIRL
ncbi:Vi polysaccharide biosynthesis UDP-N-acetylglucosamine C-6 dehydrogenase TviB [Planctobacterium marinum]|uniref:Vi polysaccharide biosynthesis UDP-N-acetylglucosamine C-6 dehydrogenase TviB n=1 Tax=Planctobacterium marinum TaxID=1631968 RepID=UPI001E4AB53D|nr:Vi polysaccharide biosynthesis UDP-N-acetylglucosamine C-6 dehydrogenase TviB [Planctobacterium marinum]MCC2606146.1 Vi polysaccharide biosynthesis UDP-N-acetylglucosamine C-6 dehydrogenase TviB [Planctobacterium marinum]